MFNLYKTYNKAKDVFVKPKLRLQFGRWYNTTGLPVWRRGPILDLYRLLGIDNVSIDTSESTWFASKYKWTETFKREHPIFSKIFKPTYSLPIWLSFYIFDYDVIWKWKYDDIRFEFPPQFTVVFFGLAFTLMLSAPIDKERGYADNDSYWEGILNYIHNGNNLKKAMSETGYYNSWNRGKKGRNYWRIRPYFIKPHYLPDYYAAKSELNEELFREDKETNLPN